MEDDVIAMLVDEPATFGMEGWEWLDALCLYEHNSPEQEDCTEDSLKDICT